MDKCEAIIRLSNDWGDSMQTFECQLTEGHRGRHKISGDMGYGDVKTPFTITWRGNEFGIEGRGDAVPVRR